MEKWTFVLSVIGAAAWIPIAFVPIANHFRQIDANLFEFKVMTDCMLRPIGGTTYKRGVMVLMVVNMFIKNVDYYPVTVNAKIKLKNGDSHNAVLLDYSAITSVDYGVPMRFNLPLHMEFNVSRTIRKNTDNVKCIALGIEGIEMLELNDVDEIIMEFNSDRINKKTVKISNTLFPLFNGTEFIETQKEGLRETQNEELVEYMERFSGIDNQPSVNDGK